MTKKKVKKPRPVPEPPTGTDDQNAPEPTWDAPVSPMESMKIAEALTKREVAMKIGRATRELRIEPDESFEVSGQFVTEFLRYMETHFVSYERFPAIVQHILLMRKAVQR